MEIDVQDMLQAIANQRNAYADESAKFYALAQKLERDNATLVKELADERAKHETPADPPGDPV